MRPTFMGFETAKRGLMVNQKAMDIVGNNLGNMGVTGYTRQRVDQVSISTHGMNSKYATDQHMMAGQGAAINGVSQIRDPYLDKRFRQEFSDVGYYEKTTEVMLDVESALDEFEGTSGMNGALQKLWKSLESLAGAQGNTTTNANIVRTAAKSMTQVLKQFDAKLNNVIDQQKYDAELSVDHVNSLLDRIASLNESIQRDVFAAEGGSNYFGSNELLDERNVLLDELSKYGNIDIQTNRDSSVTVKMGGHEVINGNKAETLSYVANADNTISITWQSTGKDVGMDKGVIFASLNMINGRGPAATGNENFERGVPYYKDQIDTLSKTIAKSFNNSIPVLGADGQPSVDADGKFVYKQLFTFEADKKEGAGSITITDEWDKDPAFIMGTKNVVDDKGNETNEYYNAMIAIAENDLDFGNGFTGTLSGYVKNYGTTLTEDYTFNNSRLSASSAISESLLDSISQVSGVSMDEEGADMMAYNKVYSALGRIMTAMDEALDVLINRTGLVGR